MSALVFLLIAVTIVAVAGAWLWYHERRPTSIEDGVEGFRRELEALAPGRRTPGSRSEDGPATPVGTDGGSAG